MFASHPLASRLSVGVESSKVQANTAAPPHTLCSSQNPPLHTTTFLFPSRHPHIEPPHTRHAQKKRTSQKKQRATSFTWNKNNTPFGLRSVRRRDDRRFGDLLTPPPGTYFCILSHSLFFSTSFFFIFIPDFFPLILIIIFMSFFFVCFFLPLYVLLLSSSSTKQKIASERKSSFAFSFASLFVPRYKLMPRPDYVSAASSSFPTLQLAKKTKKTPKPGRSAVPTKPNPSPSSLAPHLPTTPSVLAQANRRSVFIL